jgi:hypothetical protein
MADTPGNFLLVLIPVAVILAFLYFVHTESKAMLLEVRRSQGEILKRLGAAEEDPDVVLDELTRALQNLEKQGGFGSPIIMHVVGEENAAETKLPPILEELTEAEVEAFETSSQVRKRKKSST